MSDSLPRRSYVCRHIIVELNGCPSDALNDAQLLESMLFDAAKMVNTRVEAHITHQFQHQGVTCVAIVSASHLSVHTWPESGYAGLDLMVYDTDFEICEVVDRLAERLGATTVNYMEVRRGLISCGSVQR